MSRPRRLRRPARRTSRRSATTPTASISRGRPTTARRRGRSSTRTVSTTATPVALGTCREGRAPGTCRPTRAVATAAQPPTAPCATTRRPSTRSALAAPVARRVACARPAADALRGRTDRGVFSTTLASSSNGRIDATTAPRGTYRSATTTATLARAPRRYPALRTRCGTKAFGHGEDEGRRPLFKRMNSISALSMPIHLMWGHPFESSCFVLTATAQACYPRYA